MQKNYDLSVANTNQEMKISELDFLVKSKDQELSAATESMFFNFIHSLIHFINNICLEISQLESELAQQIQLYRRALNVFQNETVTATSSSSSNVTPTDTTRALIVRPSQSSSTSMYSLFSPTPSLLINYLGTQSRTFAPSPRPSRSVPQRYTFYGLIILKYTKK